MRKWTLQLFISVVIFFSVSYILLLTVPQKMILDMSCGNIYSQSQMIVFTSYYNKINNYGPQIQSQPTVYLSSTKYWMFNPYVYMYENWTAQNKDKCLGRKKILPSSLFFIYLLLSIAMDNETIRVYWAQVLVRESRLVYVRISQ